MIRVHLPDTNWWNKFLDGPIKGVDYNKENDKWNEICLGFGIIDIPDHLHDVFIENEEALSALILEFAEDD